MSMTPVEHIAAGEEAQARGVLHRADTHYLAAIAKTLATAEYRISEIVQPVELVDEHPRYGSGDKIPATLEDIRSLKKHVIASVLDES